MVTMGVAMKLIFSALLFAAFLTSCAHKRNSDTTLLEDTAFPPETSSSAPSKKGSKATGSDTAKTTGIVVDNKDLQALDKMTKAVEAYVIKGDKKSFSKLCTDKRFDCSVDEVAFPKGKKKITRLVPPYATGTKMGLQGEKRIHVKYDFYP